MLPRQMFCTAVAAGIALSMSAANAQFYGNGCSSCAPVVSAPATSCVPIQPVQVSCTQRVPVTTYRREKQTVREPYYRTTYEDREVTVMRPVTTQREIEIPTVSYRNVTDYRTVNRDMGRWVTRYTPVQKCSPCQVDSRPGFMGWLNRTGYAFRTAFTPNYHTSRQYVPQMMACTVPVTRQVAVRGTRRVTVNETRMVAEKRTDRVAVQKLDYRERVVEVMRPQTAWRDVPIGTQLAYGYGGYYGATTAFAPTIIDSRTASVEPEADPGFAEGRRRSARRSARNDDNRNGTFPEDGPGGYERGDDSIPATRSSHSNELPVDDEFSNDYSDETPGFDLQGNSRHRKPRLVIPAAYERSRRSQESSSLNIGWKRTSRRTALRSHSGSDSVVSQVSATDNSIQ